MECCKITIDEDWMIKVFCGKEATPTRCAVLEKGQGKTSIEYVTDIEKSHFVFYPSKQEIHQAKSIGLPFYTPKDGVFRRVRLYLKQILREFFDDILTLRIAPPPH